MGKRLRSLSEQESLKIQVWRRRSQRIKRLRGPINPHKKNSRTPYFECGDDSRDKIRAELVAVLSRVADEVGEEITDKVNAFDVIEVAVSVESVMYKKLGPFERPKKLKDLPMRMKYKSIMSEIGNQRNPDLRRKLLLGQLSPYDLLR